MRTDDRGVPGFTAEAAMRPASRRYRSARAGTPAGAAGAIVPSTIPLRRGGRAIAARAYGITMTCTASDWEQCVADCDAMGGGMQTNPNGTVSCIVY